MAKTGWRKQGTSYKAYRHHEQRHSYVYRSLAGAI